MCSYAGAHTYRCGGCHNSMQLACMLMCQPLPRPLLLLLLDMLDLCTEGEAGVKRHA
jgi:hypothetical protein